MAGLSARWFSIVLLLPVLCWGPQVALGQSELPAVVPANPAADQLPPRRSFAPLPINDLRSSASSSSGTGNLPAPIASAETANASTSAPPQTGTTNGVFLRPQPVPQTAPQNASATEAPATFTPAELQPPGSFAQQPSAQQPSADSIPFGSALPLSAPGNSNSRPVELIPEQPIQDSQIRLASGSEPGTAMPNRVLSGPAPGSAELAQQLLERYELKRVPDPLPGQPIRLEDALQASPPDRRRAIVRQYWQTYGAWVSYLNRCDRCVELAGVTTGSDMLQAQLLETTRLMAEDERLQAELRLQSAQLDLARLLPSAGSELLPLPADQPLVQPYETHYDWYVANGALPPPVQAIARMLPKQLELVQHRAATAESALSGSSRVAGQSGAGSADLSTRLAALELAGQAQQAFLQSVLDYNQWIADYSLSITPAGQNPTAVAAMLVAPRRINVENPSSVLVQTPNERGSSRWNDRNRLTVEPPSAMEPGGFAPQRQPIERVSGLEPAGTARSSGPPAVAPAFGASPASFGVSPAAGSGFSPPPTTPPAAAPSSPAEKLQPLPAGGNGSANTGTVGGSFTPPGSFAPPPSIPSFDPPQSPPAEDKAPAPAPTGSGGTGFKLGG